MWKIKHLPGFADPIEPYDRLPGSIATFPVELVAALMLLGSKKNNWILDPFLGSGTTMDTAIRLKRNCLGIEINKDYCKLSYNRCEKLVDKTKDKLTLE